MRERKGVVEPNPQSGFVEFPDDIRVFFSFAPSAEILRLHLDFFLAKNAFLAVLIRDTHTRKYDVSVRCNQKRRCLFACDMNCANIKSGAYITPRLIR